MRASVVMAAALFLVPHAAAAADPSAAAWLPATAHNPWQVSWLEPAATAPAAPLTILAPRLMDQDAQPALHAAAVEHSDAYLTRAKIHKYASFATLPLFAAEYALGQSLYDSSANAGSKRGAHAFIGASIVGLFGVNTVTGAWNLFGEGRQDTEGRTLRLVHGLLMMAADVGFLATAASGPNSGGQRGALTFQTDKVTHRNIALASISVGTAGYLLMLFGNH